jgi:hypothetical protein
MRADRDRLCRSSEKKIGKLEAGRYPGHLTHEVSPAPDVDLPAARQSCPPKKVRAEDKSDDSLHGRSDCGHDFRAGALNVFERFGQTILIPPSREGCIRSRTEWLQHRSLGKPRMQPLRLRFPARVLLFPCTAGRSAIAMQRIFSSPARLHPFFSPLTTTVAAPPN